MGFGHNGPMPPKIAEEPRTERLTVTMTPRLRARLAEAREKSGNTMNGEIHARLEASLDDPAQQLASAVWLMLRRLDDDDRAMFANMIVAMARDPNK
jgi:hypothetical protein